MRGRGFRHGALAAGIGACMIVAALVGPEGGALDRQSIVSAYLCLGLLCCSLLIGPYRAIAGGRPTLNNYLRRDIGIWAGLTGMVHFFLANVLSMNYEYLGRFVDAAAVPPSPAVRSQLYGSGTIMGYVVAVLFLLLLALSNDRVMRGLGLRWWKRLQRSGYLAFALTVLHSFAFQALESRAWLWVAVLAAAAAIVLGGQLWGRATTKGLSTTPRSER